MIEHQLFSHKQGGGFISDSFREMEMKCATGPNLKLGDTLLIPGQAYDLEGFFNRLLLFVGLYDANPHQMIFYIGEYDNKQYFQEVFWISENRFYIQYMPNGGRDYNKVNGVWDFTRKGKKSKAIL